MERILFTPTIAIVFSGLLGGAVIANGMTTSVTDISTAANEFVQPAQQSSTPATEMTDHEQNFKSTLALNEKDGNVFFTFQAKSFNEKT